MKLAFTLLHYNNITVTKKAVEYLLLLEEIEKAHIIIVDNASPNGSGKKLKELYSHYLNIHIIINNTNGGFAKGNNIGYRYAKNDLNCDVIVVMNNDIFIKDKKFILTLSKSADEINSEIIAPNIIGKRGPQNPFRIKRMSNKDTYKMLIYNRIAHTIYYIPVLNNLYIFALEHRKKSTKRIIKNEESGISCIPHGACVIYLKKWIFNEDFAFVPDTFMYFEEDVLAEYMNIKKYTAKLENSLTVYHVEDASVDYDNQTMLVKRKFISGCMVKSIKIMLSIRKNGVSNLQEDSE